MIFPNLYYFHQFVKTEAWRPALGADLIEIMHGNVMPRYHTVLGMESAWTEEIAPSYYGPLYFDIDIDGDITKAIASTRQLVSKLCATGLQPEALHLFASGGKGFHLEVDPLSFGLVKPMPRLPAIYKLVAQEFMVDGLDLVVYSERKGRMWRCENAKRENGRYKVRITYDELSTMTEDSYVELTSKPRCNVTMPIPARLSPPLLSLFTQARNSVSDTTTRIATKSTHKSSAFGLRFKGKLPPTLLALCQAKFASPAGWNKICMQLSLAAHECGISETALLQACNLLIAEHSSDGKRYDTPRARLEELSRMYGYVANCPSYECTVAGIRSILPHGMPCPDLRGL